MIPRFKPYLGKEELLAAISPDKNAVEKFEAEFARTFEAKYALAFPYGRSALWALFKAMNIHGAEIIMPAYTCVVVAHAIVLSGNIPRFVDVVFEDFNMNLDQVEEAINEKTRAIIATHLFGYPVDVERLNQIVKRAERKYEKKIWIIQDCAHGFGTRWKGNLVCKEGDLALFGLNISKIITSIFGGMITTQNEAVAQKLNQFREENFSSSSWLKSIRRCAYLLAVYAAFEERIYALAQYLAEKTPLLDHFTKAYHLDDKIHFPGDSLGKMASIEARLGIQQLGKYQEILEDRKKKAYLYQEKLRGTPGLILHPIIEGATYSHCVLRINDRDSCIAAMRQYGIEVGRLIDYSVPQMKIYRDLVPSSVYFPVSSELSRKVINLPIHQGLSGDQISKIAERLKTFCQERYT